MLGYPPNFVLALTGSTIIFPGVYGLIYTQKYYGSVSSLLLGLTSIGFHSTHNSSIELMDKLAILNFTISGYYHTYNDYSDKVTAQLIFSTVFNASVFFLGLKYNILCFDLDVKTQTFYHMLIHFFSAHTIYKIISYNGKN